LNRGIANRHFRRLGVRSQDLSSREISELHIVSLFLPAFLSESLAAPPSRIIRHLQSNLGLVVAMRVVDAAARHPDRLEAPCPHRRSGDGSDPGDFVAVSLVPDCAARGLTPPAPKPRR